MRCTSCGDDTPAGKRFCANCGAAQVDACSGCGSALIPGKRFCADCGRDLSGATVSSGPSSASRSADNAIAATPVAERRLCSVLFVDLVGFTTLAEHRDHEQVRELLSTYFDEAQRIVAAYGGTIEKFIGDAVMAIWGAPVANEDDAERAVRAALDLVVAVRTLGRDAGYDGLEARGGVVTGEVAVTIGKVAEGMVLGDTVNTASRVQSAAQAGTVLVDESTWRAASDAIAFEEFGELDLKGKSEVVHAWRALRVVAQRKGQGRANGLEPPFVGRDEDIRLIKDLLHATSREQRARLVSVTGIAGIGKSRLAWEFVKYVDGLAENVYWHQGRSRTYGEGITFGALGEMVRMRAGILESEDASETAKKLRACIDEFIEDHDERQWIEPRLAHLLGLVEAPSGDRDELFSAWRTFFERIARRGVTILVFEDLQWADPGLIDFVESIPEWSKTYPILVITLSRPELIDRRANWGSGQRNFISLHLDALSEKAMRELLEGFVAGLDDKVTNQVLERAEGVPLYAVETIRMLLDKGLLVLDGERYRVEGTLDLLEVPETLHALIASRLDSLTGAQRTLIQDAGIVGSTFYVDTLLAVSEISRDALDDSLRDLVRKEFLFVDTDPRSPERGQYGFVQAVLREVAVGMLSRRDRSAKHLKVARYAESLGDDELAEIIAAQYLEAIRSAPEGNAEREWSERAITWLDRASERAISLGSPEDALSLLSQAIELEPTGDQLIEIVSRAADAAQMANNDVRHLALRQEALALESERGDVTKIGFATIKYARALAAGRRGDESDALLTAAYEALSDDADLLLRGTMAEALGNRAARHSDDRSSLLFIETALEIAERLDDSSLLARALGSRSLAIFQRGRHREAVLLARGMAEIADADNSLREQAVSRLGLSLYMLPDDPRKSIVIAHESLEFARRAGLRAIELTNLLNIAETSLYMGLWSEVSTAFRALDGSSLSPNLVNWLECMKSTLTIAKGDQPASEEYFSSFERHSDGQANSDLAVRTTLLSLVSMGALAVGRFELALSSSSLAVEMDPTGINVCSVINFKARSALWTENLVAARSAVTDLEPLHGRTVAALRSTAQAGVAALEGRRDDAIALYCDAIELWRALENLMDLAQCITDYVKLLGREHPDAVIAKEARDIYIVIGARPLLERLDSLTN